MLFDKRLLKKNTKEQDEAFDNMMREEKVSFKDKLAMVIAAFGVIVLPCLLVLVGICVLVLLLFGML